MSTFEEQLQTTETKSGMLSLSKNREFKTKVLEMTKYIDELGFVDVPLKIRCMYLIRGEWPQCDVCGKPVSWIRSDYSKGWNKTCSSACKVSKTELKIAQLEDRDWLYEQRITNKRSVISIARELNCSEPHVNKWLKLQDIPHVRYNSSDNDIFEKLNDRELLYRLHVEERKKIRDIAVLLNTSGPTVSHWLNRHGIETNEPNSYDRPYMKQSKPELEVFEFVKSLGFDPVSGNRRVLGNLQEIDILISEKKVAIEFNGLYTHVHRPHETSDTKIRGPNYHLTKTQLCEDKGYTLIHIFEDDWRDRRPIVESIIRSKLGKTSRVAARKCEVVEVKQSERSAFMRANHIQGDAPAAYSFGLRYMGDLVACMTFGKSRFNKKYDWELVRYASKLNTTVVGGFSRILKKWDKPGTIVSYADRTISKGNVYQTNGFELVKINPPGYWYVKNYKHKYHRSQFMKKRIAPGDPRSEHVIMKERGYDRMWNCGTLVFVKS